MIPSQQQDPNQYGNSGTGFAAHPRVVNQKQKFKDPYGRPQEEYVPQNIMYDKRVVRGSTHAAMVIPAGTYPDTLFSGASPNKQNRTGMQGAANKSSKPPAAADDFFSRDIKTPEPGPNRQNIDIQTDQFVEELTDKAPNYEIGCQTDFRINRPPTAHSIPIKRGKDAKTLVEDNELFIFDHDVQPILSVLCGKTLELARMEVLEEEELRVMREQQKHFDDVRTAETMEAQRMEQQEIKKKQEFEKRKANEREKKKNKVAAHKKVVCRMIAKQCNQGMRDNAYRHLADVGYFTNSFKNIVLEKDVLPWLENKVISFVHQLDELNKFPDNFIQDHFQEFENEHKQTVEAKKQRQEEVHLEKERLQREKEEDKKRRKAAREQQRKQNELKKLKEEINVHFVQKGESKEHILNQDIIEINGMNLKTPCVGGLGGMLGQIILCVNAIHKHWKKDVDILNPKVLQNFLFLYIDVKMRTEKLIIQVGKPVEEFLLSLPQPLQLNEMRVMKEANYQRFRQILSDTSLYGDEIMRILREHHKKLGISKKAYDAVYEGLWDLYCKKPQTPDINAKKLDGFVPRIKLVVPPQDIVPEDGGEVIPSPVQLPLKAIVRIRIPLKRPQIEPNSQEFTQENEDEESKQKTEDEIKQSQGQLTARSEKYEEIDLEDKVWAVPTIGEASKIYVIHQAAQRLLRKDIAQHMKKNIRELEVLDLDEMLERVEQDAVQIEQNFLKMYDESEVPEEKVPVFDFEIN